MKNLKKIREGKRPRMTREQLCVATDIPFVTLKAYELDQRNPKLVRAKKLAEALGVSIDDLG